MLTSKPINFEYLRDGEDHWLTEDQLDGKKKVIKSRWQFNGKQVLYEGISYYFELDNVFEVHPYGLKLPFQRQLILNPDGTERVWLDLPYITEFGDIPENSTFYGGSTWSDGRLAFRMYYGLRELLVLFDLNTGEMLNYDKKIRF